MGDPVATAARLSHEIDLALKQLTLAPARVRELTGLRDKAANIRQRLSDFAENVAPLGFEDGQEIADIRRRFASLPEGVLAEPAGLREFVAASPLLRKLTSAGLTVTSFRKLSDGQERLGHLLGDRWGDVGEIWLALRNQPDTNSLTHIPVQKSQLHVARQFAKTLSTLGLFKLTAVHALEMDTDGDWVTEASLTDAARKQQRADHPYRLTFCGLGNTEHKALFTGEWLNGYAASIISDHLDASLLQHEIYTSVAYQNPREILRGGSDFDVIVEARGVVALFECKTGKLPSDQVKRAIGRAEGLASIIESTGAHVQLHHFLLFLGATSDAERVTSCAAGSPVAAITPDQLRGVLNTTFRGASPSADTE
ncbi:MAG: hypothetical protein WBF71_03665 [Microthrixaceae bacterium]